MSGVAPVDLPRIQRSQGDPVVLLVFRGRDGVHGRVLQATRYNDSMVASFLFKHSTVLTKQVSVIVPLRCVNQPDHSRDTQMLRQADIRANVTSKIVAALQSGAVPFWRQTWAKSENSGPPTSATSGKPYRGINRILLGLLGHQSKWWATYNGWQSLGGQVRRRERGTTAILYKPVTKKKVNKEGEEESSSFALMKTFTLFHISQVDGELKQFRDTAPAATGPTFVDYSPAEEAFAATRADVRSEGGRAFYSPSGDFIQMPPKSSFEKAHEYYGVLAHESVHWSGHESRLNRLSKFARFGDEAYAVEELVAELGAAFLLTDLRVPQTEELDENVTAYLGHWLKVLQRDHSAIFTAASAANAAADHILSYSRPNDQAEVEETGSELVAA